MYLGSVGRVGGVVMVDGRKVGQRAVYDVVHHREVVDEAVRHVSQLLLGMHVGDWGQRPLTWIILLLGDVTILLFAVDYGEV